MAVLSNEDIKKALKKGIIKITPLEESQIGPASVDLTLSDEWYVFKKGLSRKNVDLLKAEWKDAVKPIKAKSIVLKHDEICLGKTLERITLPSNIIGKLEGRSRYARMGLSVHITSALVQPGSDNHQVLEIGNMAPFPVVLHAGMRVSQIVFFELKSPSSKPYAKFGEVAVNQ
jgi:dCTP deaminase